MKKRFDGSSKVTEMADRWNDLAARQPATYGGTCPGKEFPDVGTHRSQQGKAEN